VIKSTKKGILEMVMTALEVVVKIHDSCLGVEYSGASRWYRTINANRAGTKIVELKNLRDSRGDGVMVTLNNEDVELSMTKSWGSPGSAERGG
jgi:hypothetical protein